jgi:hypothetical protein
MCKLELAFVSEYPSVWLERASAIAEGLHDQHVHIGETAFESPHCFRKRRLKTADDPVLLRQFL